MHTVDFGMGPKSTMSILEGASVYTFDLEGPKVYHVGFWMLEINSVSEGPKSLHYRLLEGRRLCTKRT